MDSTDSKQCSRCREVKPYPQFFSNKAVKDGYNCYCRTCCREKKREARERKRPTDEALHEKTCLYCFEVKPLTEFGIRPGFPDGHGNKCKACSAAYTAAVRPEYTELQRERREAAKTVAEMTEKPCPRCGQSKPATPDYFGRDRKAPDGLLTYCKTCVSELAKFARDGDVKRYRNYTRESMIRKKLRTMQHYSSLVPTCACCGEHRLAFLCMDHINGGGSKLRKEQGGGYRFYKWLERQGYPDGHQVLCHNCNMAKGFFGRCPHEDEHRPSVKSV